jgi:hypothetical protein
MKLTIILANFLALFTLIEHVDASYDCYNGGLMGLAPVMYYHVKRACKGYDGNKGKFQGTFKPKEHRKACVTTGATKLILEMKNMQSRSEDIKDQSCHDLFDDLVSKCTSRGLFGFGGRGTSTSGKWYIR